MAEQGTPSAYSPHEIEAILSLASTVEPVIETPTWGEPRPANVLRTDFSQFTSREVVTAISAVNEAKYREQQEHSWKLGHSVDPVELTDVERRLADYDVDSLLDEMPRLIGVDKTRDVFTMLANGGRDDRRTAARWIGVLTAVDHDYGLELWKRFLQEEPDVWVANVAGEGLVIHEDDDPAEFVKSLAEDGLTFSDWMYLLHLYVQRLQGELYRRDTSP